MAGSDRYRSGIHRHARSRRGAGFTLAELMVASVVVSMALVVSGMQWSRNLETATVLDIRGNVEALLEFVKSMVIAMGSKRLMIERPDMCSSILDNALTFLQANPGSDNQTALTHALKAYESEGRVYGIVELGLE